MEKMLVNVDDKELLKRATEKAWKDFKDTVKNKERLKQLLKRALKKEKDFFTYSWKIDDCRKYGTLYGDEFENYENVLKILNYTQNYSAFDSKFTKEIDAGFIFDEKYWLGKVNLIEYIFGAKIKKSYGEQFVYVENEISDKLKNFLNKYGYTLYKKYKNYGSFKQKRYYLVG